MVTSTSGAGHYGPLAPFVRSFRRGGHDVLVAGPPELYPSVRDAEFWAFGVPPSAEMAAVYGSLPGLAREQANARVIGEVFGRLDATAALPRLLDAIVSWRPDVVIRESAEFGGLVAAEVHGTPHARVAIGLGEMEHLVDTLATPNVDLLRGKYGLTGPNRLAGEPVLTLFPAGLEDPAAAVPERTVRFRDSAWSVSVPSGTRPFVYVTFGSVTGNLGMVAGVYAAALEAVADLDADVLLTVGRDTDPSTLGPVPGHVRVERWVDQASVLGRASVVVCHGGGGSTLGALAAGVPLVVVPLFSSDQFINARRVGAVGAGVVAEAEGIRTALDTVLGEPAYRSAAGALATELARHRPTEEAVDLLAAYWSGVDR
jgi:UDP:flavonoid glycosyltransferase YjiC (YdhE family)